MIDLIQVQEDLYGLLMSAPQLATVNIVQERKFLLAHELEIDALWQTLRNGCQGNGLLIETPGISVNSSNVTGPPQSVELSFVSIQSGDSALLSASEPGAISGGGLYAEQIEQYLVDILHLQNIQGVGTITCSAQFSSPATDYPMVNARRTKMQCTPRQTAQTPRTALVQAARAGNWATLTVSTPGALIYYTLDGSYPSSVSAVDPLSNSRVNAASSVYVAPFAVASGTIIRAAAYAPGFNVGPVNSITVS